MTANTFDAIVVGARVAGAPTAMLLARKGYRVLLVDRATFPSDTMSTHLIHAPGMALLHRWGLADRVIATGCPPVTAYRLDLGPFAIAGAPRGTDVEAHAFAPRRTVLDAILVDAAAEAGADVRQGTSVDSLIMEDGVVRGIRAHDRSGASFEERARVVIGADGVHSSVARWVGSPMTHEVPALEALYYAYWSAFPTDGEFQLYQRDQRGFGVIPTNDDLTVVVVTWPVDEFEANRNDLLGNYLRAFEADPSLAERAREARRETRLVGAKMQNFYRRSHGPGWALIGDAGYHKDAVTAQGMTDAFRDAELVSSALDDAFSGRRSQDEALAGYERERDGSTRPMFDLTCQLASHEPPSDEEVELFAAIASHEDATRDFVSVLAGTMPVEAFFDPANLERYVPEPRTPATAI
ncbi:MAG TPA: NAD(P)/FAD-dependent oxidoreductase [Actinomycetota bacterium]|nr:NAD(P)/FAD-dependent oxidoreductase [Actinomycetota bacterium]